MPTAQEAIDRSRQLLNEQAPGLYTDTAAGFFHWIDAGTRHFHREVLQLIRMQSRGQLPQSHPYIRHWLTEVTANTVVGQQDYDLPATLDVLLYVMVGNPLRMAERSTTVTQPLDSLSRKIGARPGIARWTEAPGSTLRLFVHPGVDGVPAEVIPYRLTFLKLVTRVTSAATVLDLPWEYLDTALWYIMAQAVVKERKVFDAFLTMGREQVKAIP